MRKIPATSLAVVADHVRALRRRSGGPGAVMHIVHVLRKGWSTSTFPHECRYSHATNPLRSVIDTCRYWGGAADALVLAGCASDVQDVVGRGEGARRGGLRRWGRARSWLTVVVVLAVVATLGARRRYASSGGTRPMVRVPRGGARPGRTAASWVGCATWWVVAVTVRQRGQVCRAMWTCTWMRCRGMSRRRRLPSGRQRSASGS